MSSAVLFAACGGGGGTMATSMGRPMEILVTAEWSVWESVVGDTLKSVLTEDMAGLNQPEPMFEMIFMPIHKFNGTVASHRNVVALDINPKYAETAMNGGYDVHARPQLVVSVTAPTAESAAGYISEHRKELQQIFERAESAWLASQAKKKPNAEIEAKIEEMFGFKMTIPGQYFVGNSIDGDFLWIRDESPRLASLGIVIYSYPYSDRTNFEADSLLKRRDQFMALVPGEPEGSYMGTSTALDPQVEYMRVNGRFWAKMHGLWDMKGDFMGGPFVSYSTLDTENNRVVCIDEYVFHPNEKKRDLVRRQESYILNVEFPGDEAIRNSTAMN